MDCPGFPVLGYRLLKRGEGVAFKIRTGADNSRGSVSFKEDSNHESSHLLRKYGQAALAGHPGGYSVFLRSHKRLLAISPFDFSRCRTRAGPASLPRLHPRATPDLAIITDVHDGDRGEGDGWRKSGSGQLATVGM